MVKTLKDTYQDKALSNAFRSVMNTKLLSQVEAAKTLQMNISSFRNKLSRNVFSLYDFIAICSVCDCNFTIFNETGLIIDLTPEKFLSLEDQEHIRIVKSEIKKEICGSLNDMPEWYKKSLYLKLKKEFGGDACE